MTDEMRMRYLTNPPPGAKVILDTDTYNEIDDQFALSYLVKLKKFDIQGFTAAPFFNDRSSSPEDGMVKSFDEIKKLLAFLGEDYPVFEGSRSYLPDEETPVDSPAARFIRDTALAMPEGEPLYVAAIGAVTNVASAILLDPRVADKMTLVWLGGNAFDWPDNREFNLFQDVPAAQVVLGCGMPVVLLPCMGVVSSFISTRYELEHFLLGKNPLADYLCRNTVEYTEKRSPLLCWGKQIWDVAAIGWLAGEGFMRTRLVPAPIPEPDGHWAFDETRPLIRVVSYVDRDRLFADLVEKITGESLIRH
ncbi:MAG: nucleoside hydrolase [Clostridia bacterium]|nr:nucleoside hydrolase [Clostridia bacterium]